MYSDEESHYNTNQVNHPLIPRAKSSDYPNTMYGINSMYEQHHDGKSLGHDSIVTTHGNNNNHDGNEMMEHDDGHTHGHGHEQHSTSNCVNMDSSGITFVDAVVSKKKPHRAHTLSGNNIYSQYHPSSSSSSAHNNHTEVECDGEGGTCDLQLYHAPPSPEIQAGRVKILGATVRGQYLASGDHKEEVEQLQKQSQSQSPPAPHQPAEGPNRTSSPTPHTTVEKQNAVIPVNQVSIPPIALPQSQHHIAPHNGSINNKNNAAIKSNQATSDVHHSAHTTHPHDHTQANTTNNNVISNDKSGTNNNSIGSGRIVQASQSQPQGQPHAQAQGSQPTNEFKAWVEESPDQKWARYDKPLGRGTFKEVWLAVDTEGGREVAWNVVDLRRLSDADHKRIRAETDLLTQLRHPHIIEIYDVFELPHKQQLCFVTEKMSYTLKQHINNLHPAKIKVVKKYCRQILRALAYLHSFNPPIIHRDLKCDNIFIDGSTGDAKLGDFGLAINQHAATSMIGTPGFMAPELFAENYNELVDIWSFGMCVFEMATNQFPYMECNGVVSSLLRKGFEGQMPANIDKIKDASMREFIKMCLRPVHKRPSATQLLENSIFDLTEPLPQPPKPIDSTATTRSVSSNNIAATVNALDAQSYVMSPDSTQPSQPSSKQQQFPQRHQTSPSSASVPPSTLILNNTQQSQQPSSAATQQSDTPTSLPQSPSPKTALDRQPSGSNNNNAAANSESAQLTSNNSIAPAASNTLTDSTETASQSQSQSKATSDKLVNDKVAEEERQRQENIRRAEQLIAKVDVTKTDNPAVVSISLHCMLPKAKHLQHDDVTNATNTRNEAMDSPSLPSLSSSAGAIGTSEFESKQILIPSYDFSKDNYITVATQLVRSVAELKSIDIDHIEDAIAARIEASVKRYYDKWATKHRSTLNSEIMTLLSSLGINLSYAQRFIDQEVTIEDLFLLNDNDLQEFLPKLGPRRRMQQYLDTEKERRKAAAVQNLEREQQHAQLYNDEPNADIILTDSIVEQLHVQLQQQQQSVAAYGDVASSDQRRRKSSADDAGKVSIDERTIEREKRRNKEKAAKRTNDTAASAATGLKSTSDRDDNVKASKIKRKDSMPTDIQTPSSGNLSLQAQAQAQSQPSSTVLQSYTSSPTGADPSFASQYSSSSLPPASASLPLYTSTSAATSSVPQGAPSQAQPPSVMDSSKATTGTLSTAATLSAEAEEEILRKRERKRLKEQNAKRLKDLELRRLEKLLEDAKRSVKSSTSTTSKGSKQRAPASISSSMRSGYEESEEPSEESHMDEADLSSEHSDDDNVTATSDSDDDDDEKRSAAQMLTNALLRRRLQKAKKQQKETRERNRLPTTHEHDGVDASSQSGNVNENDHAPSTAAALSSYTSAQHSRYGSSGSLDNPTRTTTKPQRDSNKRADHATHHHSNQPSPQYSQQVHHLHHKTMSCPGSPRSHSQAHTQRNAQHDKDNGMSNGNSTTATTPHRKHAHSNATPSASSNSHHPAGISTAYTASPHAAGNTNALPSPICTPNTSSHSATRSNPSKQQAQQQPRTMSSTSTSSANQRLSSDPDRAAATATAPASSKFSSSTLQSRRPGTFLDHAADSGMTALLSKISTELGGNKQQQRNQTDSSPKTVAATGAGLGNARKASAVQIHSNVQPLARTQSQSPPFTTIATATTSSDNQSNINSAMPNVLSLSRSLSQSTPKTQ